MSWPLFSLFLGRSCVRSPLSLSCEIVPESSLSAVVKTTLESFPVVLKVFWACVVCGELVVLLRRVDFPAEITTQHL